MNETLIIGSRGSALALWQSNWVAEQLRQKHPHLTVQIEIIKTRGDRMQQAALNTIGKGAFTKEIQDGLLNGSIDVAVHSLKDLPTDPLPGLRVWAHPERFDPRDAWFGRGGILFADLPEDAVIATGALRRAAQSLHQYPKATVEPLRGNVDTRLRKFREGTMHGMFLACAGLDRLDLADSLTERLDPKVFLPAPGQGALAIEGRDDERTGALLCVLDHQQTRQRVVAERAFLATLEGGCQVPIAALAQIDGDTLTLDGLVADVDGTELIRDQESGNRAQAQTIGEHLGRRLLESGGDQILARLRSAHA